MRKKIILVDDEEQITKLLSAFLNQKVDANKEKIYEVHVFNSGNNCIDFLRAYKDVDLIVSDVRMPHGSGTDVLDFINKETPNIPLFFMTGFSGGLDTEELIAQGAKKVFAKPFKCAQLVKEIETYLK